MGYCRRIKRHFHIIKFTYKSLIYNIARSQNDFIDAAFEPLFWFVDNVTAYLGILFVFLVLLLTSSVVFLWYAFLKPVILTQSTFNIGFHFVLAHYLLINIVFHYFKACLTKPGSPPKGKPMESIRGDVVCKHCIEPKPARTHHCSICNRCYLKMDHHCPWMNNCIGFNNHRYFISFCLFMWLGTVYVCFTSYDLFIYHFRHPGEFIRDNTTVNMLHSDNLILKVFDYFHLSTDSLEGRMEVVSATRVHPGRFEEVHEWEHIGIIYLFFLCGAVTFALGMLNGWHLWLVCRGETSIEVHINSAERKKAAKHGMGYNNPYDYRWRRNLAYLFGLYKGRTVLRVLLPSWHAPEGDGMSWPSNNKPVHFADPLAYQKYSEVNACQKVYSYMSKMSLFNGGSRKD